VKDHKNINGTFAPVGAIQLSNVSVKYRQNLPIILKNINLNLKAGNLIGVCGRTGSGKSSLMLGLLRLNIICNGDVIIDGTSTSKVSLKTLRRAIGVIPQTPTLFAGTLRYNIDPTRSRYSDEDIVQVLNAIGMRIHQKKEGLNYIVEENGRNLSVGEQQCISLARACLLKAKIYLLDECTANIDYATDQMIQNMLRTHPSFVNATVVIVAHRLSTIKDVNQIVVMDNGVVLETGSPQELLSDETSAYSKMMGDVDVSGGSGGLMP
jgi:ABC-type multidrug transport system fused ATPase/permease subunit